MIKEDRIKRGMTAYELADAVGCHVTTIWRYERGAARPNAETLKKIATALNVEIKYMTRDVWKEQPCWHCKNFIDGCSWAKNLSPVKGWDAELREYSLGKGKKGVTWAIRSCPEYVNDGT